VTDREITNAVKSIAKELDDVEKQLLGHNKASVFVAVDRVIMLGSYCVGRMKSRTYAIRTANALNAYKPNKKGV